MTEAPAISACRLCGSRALAPVVDLGPQHLSNLFVAPGRPVPPAQRFPLEVVRCDRAADAAACGLVQLRHTVPGEVMYRDYWYKSGVNATMRAALADVAARGAEAAGLAAGDAVLDIGCNDGTLLKSYRVPGLRLFGMDPAGGVAAPGERDGLTVIQDFFDAPRFLAASGTRVKVLTSIAMFYDLPDPLAFTRGAADVLDPAGAWVIQMSYLPLMLAQTAFDNICHEHLEYYSLAVLERLLARAGLAAFDVEVNDVNGGSFRVLVQHEGAGRPATRRLESMRRYEAGLGLDAAAPYEAFSARTREARERVREAVGEARRRGEVCAYGASTKGNVLLQWCGLDAREIAYAAERNPAKWGGRTLGTDIPMVSEEEARRRRPAAMLVLPWHFLPEFLDREAEYLAGGGSMIVPLPRFTVVTKENAAASRDLVLTGHDYFLQDPAFRR